MGTTRLHGFTSFDFMTATDVVKLPGWTDNPSATVTVITPGLSGRGQAIGAPSALPYKFTNGYNVAVVRMLFKPTALTTTRDIYRFARPNNDAVVTLQLTAAGKLQLALTNVTTPITRTSTDSRSLSSGTVYAVEFGAYFADGTGEVRVFLDGLEDTSLRLRDATTQSTSGGNVDRVVLNNPDGQFDDFHIRTGQNSLRRTDFISDTEGNPQFLTLRPVADGAYSGFLGAADGLHYEEVNETQADGNTSFLYADETLEDHTRESWVLTNITLLPTRVFSVASTVHVKYDVSISLDLRQFLRYEGADYEGGEGERGDPTYGFFRRQWDVSPVTGTYWTRPELNDAELGVVLLLPSDATFEDRVSQAVLEVFFTTGDVTSPTINLTTNAATAGLKNQTHHIATLYQIERRDGFVMHFTDHNADLVFNGDTYRAAGGMDSSARRREASLREPNVEIRGSITSEKITIEDLRAGRYRSARLSEYLVDWRWPWLGALQTSVYEVQDVTYNGTSYTAQLAGLVYKLRHAIGDIYGRLCPHDLGSMGPRSCKVLLNEMIYRSVRVASVTDRRIFFANTSDIHGLRPDDYFTFGTLRWLTGDNQGLEFVVKDYTSDVRRIELQLPTPFDIAANDLFDLEPGCDKTAATCKDRFDNFVNFGGFPFMPGTDQYLQTPSASGNVQ